MPDDSDASSATNKPSAPPSSPTLVCVVQKPIYRTAFLKPAVASQRGLFDWMLKDGSSFKQLDDSDY